MVDFLGEHRETYGVESIGSVLPIAPSTYHEHEADLVDRTFTADRPNRLRVADLTYVATGRCVVRHWVTSGVPSGSDARTSVF